MAATEADGGYTPNSVRRTIRPRRGLPNGRAVVGALLVTVAAVGTFAAAGRGESGPDTAFLVITRPVEAGTPVSLDDLAFQPMDLSPAAAANAVSSATRVEGATAIHTLIPGDLLSVNDLVAGPSIEGEPLGAIHELALPVARDRVPARTGAGDRVTVLATLRLDDRPVTLVAVEDALVIGWTTDVSASATGVLTLALDDADTVTGLAHLALEGQVTVVRSTRAIDDEYPDHFSVPALASPTDSDAAPMNEGGPR